ncbi:uncharacterized protein VTP21DRAFT_1918 [Calcarisporiella thermophila]|uniref:uncharacterized protein n=1 Tax=Calcarisporiella thermophila TaxID=911321 RepID=UPI003743CC81
MSLASGRERRANAGNRLRSLLDQEVELEDMFQEVENDEEFQIKEEEADIVDSDFESTDEEEERIVEEAAAQAEAEQVEKKRRVVFPERLKKIKKPREDEKRVASEVSVVSTSSASTPRRPPHLRGKPTLSAVRKSQRSTTIQDRQRIEREMEVRMKRLASQPKRERVVAPSLTQEQLLEEAKKTEEMNRASLTAFQEMEAEKRKKAKRKEVHRIHGPFVRILSRTDGDRGQLKHRRVMVIDEGNGGRNVVREVDEEVQRWYFKYEVEEAHCRARNWVIFEGLERLPPLFPVTKRQRGPTLCPITGQVARYKDPKTGVPYANLEAFRTLRRVLEHEYIWSTVLNAYVHRADQPHARGVPDGFGDFATEGRKKMVNGERVGRKASKADGHEMVTSGEQVT